MLRLRHEGGAEAAERKRAAAAANSLRQREQKRRPRRQERDEAAGMGRARPAASASRYGTHLTPAPAPLTPAIFPSGNRSRTQPRARINRNGLSPPAAPLTATTSNAPGPLARRPPPSWCGNAPASVAGRPLKDLTHCGRPAHCLMRGRAGWLPTPAPQAESANSEPLRVA